MVGHSTDEATLSPTIKFFCSYGGKIVPCHADRKLRYIGGHNRVLAVHRSITFPELLSKLGELCGTTVSVRCQLPSEDLDALVSITCDEDLANIIEEYDRLSSPPSTLKIRVYLSPPKIKKPTTTNTNITSFTSPGHFSSASSKSSSSSTSSASSSPTLSAVSCNAACSPRCSMMPMAGDCSIRQKLLPPLGFPMGLEKSKANIASHYPVSHRDCCYHGQRHINASQYYHIHNRNH